MHSSQNVPDAKENELILKRLAEAAFKPQVINHHNNADYVSLEHNLEALNLFVSETPRTALIF